MDVKCAFLNSVIDREVYLVQPPGFENKEFPNHVFKLSKALYSLRQAPRAWYERLSSFLLKNIFQRGTTDTTLFIKNSNESFILIQIYQTENGIFIHQKKYANELVKKFGMKNAKPMGTPMHPNSKLEKGEIEKDVDETGYRGMIGSLMYLTSSRPDIVQSVGMCSRFQSKPKESHLSAVKRIIRYIHGTSNFGLWYPKIDDFSAVGYCDADFAGDRVDRRSTSGIVASLENL
ncbi:hypothetical protein AAHE18_11G078100 [Arachis hypogaea]